MKRYGVRPSVSPSICPFVADAGLLLWAWRRGDRLLQQLRAAGECGQCHVVSVRR